MKLFTSRGLVPVPAAWVSELGQSHGQAYVAVVASKRDTMNLLLGNAGAHPSVAAECRLSHGHEPAPVRQLLEARVIQLDRPAVYAWQEFGHGHGVIRMSRGHVETVARFHQDQPGSPVEVAAR